MTCGVCGGEVRVISMTAAGTTESCPCGRTKMTRLSSGELGVVRDSTLTDRPLEGPCDEHPITDWGT